MNAKEADEAAKKAALRSFKWDIFWWGWCWAQVVDLVLDLVCPPEQQIHSHGWPWLLWFVLNGFMAIHVYRKWIKPMGVSQVSKS